MSTTISRVQDGRKLKRSVFHKMRKDELASQPKTGARAVAKYIRMSPSKARSVANAIRNRDVSDALQILMFSPKKASRIMYKVLMSAVANAENNFGLSSDSLYVSEVMINEGPRMKRLLPKSRGRGEMILKRMSHITISVKSKTVK